MKKQESFVYSAENIQRIADMNQLLICQVTEVMTTAFEIYQQELEENKKSVLSTPQRCPQCRSIRTRPVSLFRKLEKKKYEPIWKQMENNQ